MDSEKLIERRLIEEIKKKGGVAWKWVSPGNNGVPDRIVLMPGGRVYFLELKSTGEKPDPLQLNKHKILRRLGFKVFVFDTLQLVIEFVELL